MCPSSTPEPVHHLPELWSWGLASSIPRSVEEQQYPPHPRGPPFFPFTPPPCFTLLQKQPSPKRPADSPEFISKSCCPDSRRELLRMKGFLFLLFTISLLIMVQIQTGVLGSNRTFTTYKKPQSGSPAFSSLAGGSILFFLTNTLIQPSSHAPPRIDGQSLGWGPWLTQGGSDMEEEAPPSWGSIKLLCTWSRVLRVVTGHHQT
uniref:CAMPATH-1 antigen n=1 Tax=Capra hircus TaxID=9925 RepID=A0A8C2NB09_CAPHI